MTQFQIITTSALTTVATLIFIGLAGWGLAAHAGDADGRWRAHAANMNDRPHGHGRHPGPCGRAAAGPVGPMARIAARLDLDADQQLAFDDLQAVLENQRARMEQLCADIEPPADALEAVGRMETFMAHALDTVRAARPAFETFYALLDESQRARVDRLLSRGPGRHGGPRGRRWHDDESTDAMDDSVAS